MDTFDQYLYEELATQYAKPNLSADDYEELYQRFCNIDYLAEVKPYLLTMWFFGLGTVAEKEAVLSELKTLLAKSDFMLKGLYYDLLLTEKNDDTDTMNNLRQMINEGYTNIFTKERSSIEKIKFQNSEEKSVSYMNINGGYIADWMNTTSGDDITLSNPYILLTDYEISSIFDILHIIDPIAVEKVPLLIIAKDVNGEALETLSINCEQQRLYAVAIRIPATDDVEALNLLSKIAAHCQATVISEKLNVPLENANATMLGRAAFVTIDKNHTVIATDPKSQKTVSDNIKQYQESVIVDYINFECGNYSGLYFTAGDIDYLAAKIYIKPFHGNKHIKVRSQIFLDGNAFSKVFENEFDIDSNTRWIKTDGWGNTNYNCYSNNIYKWVVEIDGKTTSSQEFRMYSGKLSKGGPKINNVKLFASKASGALEKDRDNYKTTFDGNMLEYVYFKFLINPPGQDMNVQIYIKVIYLEDNSVFRDKYFLHHLNKDTIACWAGIGFSKPDSWKKGLYQYSVHIGTGTKYEGTFTVY